MTVIAHEPSGFEGSLVNVEVDIRRGIPGVDLVGLAAGAVKEARERVRAAIRNSGFEFPLDQGPYQSRPRRPAQGRRGLRPADGPRPPRRLRALARAGRQVLAMGELRLDGTVRPVRGVLPAVAAALSSGIGHFIVPEDNAAEARALRRGLVYPIGRLADAAAILGLVREGIGGRHRLAGGQCRPGDTPKLQAARATSPSSRGRKD